MAELASQLKKPRRVRSLALLDRSASTRLWFLPSMSRLAHLSTDTLRSLFCVSYMTFTACVSFGACWRA